MKVIPSNCRELPITEEPVLTLRTSAYRQEGQNFTKEFRSHIRWGESGEREDILNIRILFPHSPWKVKKGRKMSVSCPEAWSLQFGEVNEKQQLTSNPTLGSAAVDTARHTKTGDTSDSAARRFHFCLCADHQSTGIAWILEHVIWPGWGGEHPKMKRTLASSGIESFTAEEWTLAKGKVSPTPQKKQWEGMVTSGRGSHSTWSH